MLVPKVKVKSLGPIYYLTEIELRAAGGIAITKEGTIEAVFLETRGTKYIVK